VKQRRFNGLKLSKTALKQLVAAEKQGCFPVVQKRIFALRLLGQGHTIRETATAVGMYPKAIRRVAWNYVDHGVENAIRDRPRRKVGPELSARQKQEVVALCCGPAPKGFARWTVRLLASEAVRRGVVPKAGRETIRLILAEHDLKPWRKKMWCVPKLDDEYVARMEAVLDVYERAENADEPVVCLDERPVVLHDSKREGTAARPGHEAREDYEYKRCGTANVFCIIEPKTGRHFTYASPDRKRPAL